MQYVIYFQYEIDSVTIHFTDEETETQRLSFLTEVTGPGLSDIGVHAFNHCAIRALPTVLDLVKLELFIRDGCGTWPLGVCLSQNQLGVGREMSLL